MHACSTRVGVKCGLCVAVADVRVRCCRVAGRADVVRCVPLVGGFLAFFSYCRVCRRSCLASEGCHQDGCSERWWWRKVRLAASNARTRIIQWFRVVIIIIIITGTSTCTCVSSVVGVGGAPATVSACVPSSAWYQVGAGADSGVVGGRFNVLHLCSSIPDRRCPCRSGSRRPPSCSSGGVFSGYVCGAPSVAAHRLSSPACCTCPTRRNVCANQSFDHLFLPPLTVTVTHFAILTFEVGGSALRF